MGLDQYIYRISKPKMENRAYTSDEVDKLRLQHAFVRDVEHNMALYKDLLPYTEKRDFIGQFYDLEKIAEDYNLPKNAHITMWSGDGIDVTGYDEKGIDRTVTIPDDVVEAKYIVTKTYPCYFWEEDEIRYWRKNYELQEYMDVENTAYVILNMKLISKLNDKFWIDIPKEDPSDETALFYWEWW